MTIVHPTTPVQLIMQPASEPTNREGRGHDLRMDQVIRATVVEDGDGKVFLQLAHRKFMAKTDLPLKAGQQLDVRVMQTHPQLQLQVLPFLNSDRIDHLLSALGYRINWAGQAQQVESLRAQLPTEMADRLQSVMTQLRQLLGNTETLKGGDLMQLTRLLGLSSEAETVERGALPANLKTGLSALFQTEAPSSRAAGEAVSQLLGQLSRWPTGSPTEIGRQLPPFLNQLQALATQLDPSVARGLEAAMNSLQNVWTAQPSAPLSQVGQALGIPLASDHPDIVFIPPDLKSGLLTLLGRIEANEVPLERRASLVADDVRHALKQLADLPTDKATLAQSVSQIRTLLDRVSALRAELPVQQTVLLDGLMQRLTQAMPPVALTGAVAENLPLSEMGWIAQALGLGPTHLMQTDFERPPNVKTALEILLGVLRLSSSGTRNQEAEAALQQLEVLQLARGKLQQEGVQLLPLPFPFLEEGYLLAEDGTEDKDGDGVNDVQRISLFLRLQALGNLRVELLYDQGGLYVRIGCDNLLTRLFLEKQQQTMSDALETLPLKGVSFDSHAADPGAELIRRLRPPERGVVDARI